MLFKAGALVDVIARPTTALWPSSDLRHGPCPLGRPRRGEGGICGEGFVHEALNDHQRSETTHSEPSFRALLTEGDAKHLALAWT